MQRTAGGINPRHYGLHLQPADELPAYVLQSLTHSTEKSWSSGITSVLHVVWLIHPLSLVEFINSGAHLSVLRGACAERYDNQTQNMSTLLLMVTKVRGTYFK